MRETGADSLTVDFSLPSGSYATQLLRELTRSPFWVQGIGRVFPGGPGQSRLPAMSLDMSAVERLSEPELEALLN